MAEGAYTDAYLQAAGADAPRTADGDLAAIATPIDFFGINVYKPAFYAMATDEAPGWRSIPFATAHPRMYNNWAALAPEAIYWAPKFVQALWKAPEISIPENGCARDDVVAPDGRVYDTDRIIFLRGFLPQLQRATAD